MAYRATLEASARSGNPDALAALVEPECPDVCWHLVEWARDLCGRSGEGMSGAAPLSYATLRDWRAEMGIRPLSPLEVRGLFALDAAMRHPEEPAANDTDAAVVIHRAWPSAKEAARG